MRFFSRFGILLLSLFGTPVDADDPGTKTAFVSGSSMQPTFTAQDEVEFQEIDSATVIERRQIVILHFQSRERRMLKRVFALPGDQLQIKDGRFFLNGELVQPTGWPDSYLIPSTAGKALRIQLKRYENTLPSGKYLLLGDNFRSSQDSLDYGLVDRSQIEGLVK